MTNKAKGLLRGSVYVFIGIIIAQAFAYLTRLLMVKNLTPTEYGLFSAVFVFIFLCLFFRDLGLNISISKYVTEFNVKKKYGEITSAILSTLYFQIILSLVFYIIIWAIAPLLSEIYFKDERANLILRILALYIPIGVALKLIPAFFKGFSKFTIFSTFEPVKNTLVFVLTLIFFSLGYNLLAPVYAYIILPIILMIIYIFPMLKTFNFIEIKSKNMKRTFKKVFLFGLPLLGVRFFSKFISYFDTLMLTAYVTLAEVGIYNIILPTSLLLMIIPTSFSSVIMPSIIEFHIKKKLISISNLLNVIYKYLYAIMLPIIISVIVLAEKLIEIFFGIEYITGALAMKILLVGVLFNAITVIHLQFFVGVHKPKINLYLSIFGSSLNIILNLILIPKYSITGAAIATCTSYIIMALLSTYYVKNSIPIKYPILNWALILISGLVFYFSLETFRNMIQYNFYINSFLSITFSCLIYFTLLYMFRIIKINEIKELIK